MVKAVLQMGVWRGRVDTVSQQIKCILVKNLVKFFLEAEALFSGATESSWHSVLQLPKCR